jgi:hypothetical protein
MLEPRAIERRFLSKKASGSPFAGWAVGVGHPISATVLRPLSVFPASL